MQKIGGTILTIGYVRYIKILTLPRGIRVKIELFFHDSIISQFPEEIDKPDIKNDQKTSESC